MADRRRPEALGAEGVRVRDGGVPLLIGGGVWRGVPRKFLFCDLQMVSFSVFWVVFYVFLTCVSHTAQFLRTLSI